MTRLFRIHFQIFSNKYFKKCLSPICHFFFLCITELDDDTKKLFQQSAEPTFGNLKKVWGSSMHVSTTTYMVYLSYIAHLNFDNLGQHKV